MIPRYGAPPIATMRYTRRPGVYAVLVRDGQVLLTHQAAPEPEYQLPGGGIDPGESPLPALAREIREETGWAIGRARRIGAYRRFTYMPEYRLWAEKLCHIYLARPTRRIGPPSEPDHHEVWAEPATAVGLMASPGDAAWISRVFGLRGRFGRGLAVE